MSKWRVKIEYDSATAVQRDAVAATLDLAFAGKSIFNTPYPARTGLDNGRFTYLRDTRFNNQTDAESVYNQVSSDLLAAVGMNGKVSIHNCTHDDARAKSCSAVEQGYQETRF